METTILHITTAKGPLECQLAAGKILGALLADLRTKGLQVETLERTPGAENGTILSATVQVKGLNIQPPVQTWFVGIYEVKTPEKLVWKEEELVYQSVRSSGSGGQHVNKVSSAIRAIHPPTGTMVFVQDSRSQLQNKKLARERMREKLEKVQLQKMIDTVNQQWSQHHELERGNPVRTFSGMDFKPKKEAKTFKKQRSQLKQELYKELNYDNK